MGSYSRKNAVLEEAMITIEKDYRRRGTRNRSTYDYYLDSDAGGREPLFLDFRQISLKMARTISSRAKPSFARSTCEIKKGGRDKEEVKKEQHARAINPFISSGTL